MKKEKMNEGAKIYRVQRLLDRTRNDARPFIRFA